MARDGLSANDPKRTLCDPLIVACLPEGLLEKTIVALNFCAGCGLDAEIYDGGSSVVAKIGRSRSTVPSATPRIGTIDQRYQTEQYRDVEVTGGKFWKPDLFGCRPVCSEVWSGRWRMPVGMDSNLFEYRSSINLTADGCEVLAAAL